MNTITINIAASDYAEMVVGNDGDYDIIEHEGDNFQVIEKLECNTDIFGTVFDTPGWDLICKEVA